MRFPETCRSLKSLLLGACVLSVMVTPDYAPVSEPKFERRPIIRYAESGAWGTTFFLAPTAVTHNPIAHGWFDTFVEMDTALAVTRFRANEPIYFHFAVTNTSGRSVMVKGSIREIAGLDSVNLNTKILLTEHTFKILQNGQLFADDEFPQILGAQPMVIPNFVSIHETLPSGFSVLIYENTRQWYSLQHNQAHLSPGKYEAVAAYSAIDTTTPTELRIPFEIVKE